VLLDASLTVIHGEFYPENVLFHEGRVGALGEGVLEQSL
jgi:hypothetical protein